MISALEFKKIRVIDLDWSQKRLAKELAVSQSLISSIENDLVQPTEKFMKKLNRVIIKLKK